MTRTDRRFVPPAPAAPPPAAGPSCRFLSFFFLIFKIFIIFVYFKIFTSFPCPKVCEHSAAASSRRSPHLLARRDFATRGAG